MSTRPRFFYRGDDEDPLARLLAMSALLVNGVADD
jgi:hypothetical protein